MTTVIAEQRAGVRLLAGTEFPVIDRVERQQWGRRVEWVLIVGLCNGIPSWSKSFATKAEALYALTGGRGLSREASRGSR